MPLKVLIVPDKFKGTLTALEAAETISRGWRYARPSDVLELLPMSDGGDGFGQVLSRLIGASVQRVSTIDAAHRPAVAEWWWESDSKTAIIESALVIGLAMLPPRKFHPFRLDTAGLAAVMRAAAIKGARQCLLGIGGSATNDGGFGLARALGWEFLEENDRRMENWIDLATLKRICPPKRRRWFPKLLVAVDVQNPLLGRRGATRVYGPQKGLRKNDFKRAEQCLSRLAQVVRETDGVDYAALPGAGAAGGLGFGLLAFLGARFEPGFDLFARYANLPWRLRSADLVITGEGAIDNSTLMGKGVGQIASRCRELKIPCLGLAGVATPSARSGRLFSQTHTLTDLTTVAAARARPGFWLEKMTAHVARNVALEAFHKL